MIEASLCQLAIYILHVNLARFEDGIVVMHTHRMTFFKMVGKVLAHRLPNLKQNVYNGETTSTEIPLALIVDLICFSMLQAFI